MENLLWSGAVVLTLFLCVYIVYTAVMRLALMSWGTHRKTWQVIYVTMMVAAAVQLVSLLEGDHGLELDAVIGLLGTALWFHESRSRWVGHAPDYMYSDDERLKNSLARHGE